MSIKTPVICMSYENNNVIGVYESVVEASRQLEMNRVNIFNNLAGMKQKVFAPKINEWVTFLYQEK